MAQTQYYRAPASAWDTIFETLGMDEDSSFIDNDIRREITRAKNKVREVDVPVGHRLQAVPPGQTALLLTAKQKRYLLEDLGGMAKWFRDNDRPYAENIPQQIIDALSGEKNGKITT